MDCVAESLGQAADGLEEVWEQFFAEERYTRAEVEAGGNPLSELGRREARRLLRLWPSLRAETCCAFGRDEGRRLYPEVAREAAEVVEEPGCVLGVVRGRTEDADLLLLGAWVEPSSGFVDAEALAWFAEGARLEVLPFAGMALPYADQEVAACRVLPVIMDLSPRYRGPVLAEAARVAVA